MVTRKQVDEMLDSILLIENGDTIVNLHSGTEYIVVNIEETNILLMTENGEKSLIYWNELLENFKNK